MQEKKNYKVILKYLWIVYALFSIAIVLYLANNLVCKDMMNVSNRIVLNNGWDITINGESYSDVALDSFLFETVEKGDKIEMETKLPDDWGYKQAVLCVHNRHTTMSMYIDDVLEYEYGHDRYEQGKTTGSGFLFINFLDEYKGKTLKLQYYVTEYNAFSKFDEVWFGEWINSYRYIITDNRVPMLTGSFLIVFGLMMAFVLVFAVTVSKKYRNVLFLSIFSICIGLWTLCYYNVVIVFSIPLYSISLMEYMSLFLAPIPIVAYMNGYVKELYSKRITLIYNLLFLVQLVMSVVTIALHTADIVHGAHLLPVFQFMFIIHMGFFSYILIQRMKKDALMKKVTIIGLMLVVVCVLYELASYSITRYVGYSLPEVKGISSAGFIVFIGILVLDLYKRVTKSMMEEQEKALLIKRAYTDELTQLYNRGYCTDYMKTVSEKNIDYGIVNIDLNNLKITNDTFGHVKGDELICQAAFVIKKAFEGNGVVGRMGGDEFIAIIDNGEKSFMEKLLNDLTKLIEDVNKENPQLNLSISHGYAMSSEIEDNSPEMVYQLADKRMYENKRMYKASQR